MSAHRIFPANPERVRGCREALANVDELVREMRALLDEGVDAVGLLEAAQKARGELDLMVNCALVPLLPPRK